MAVKNEPQKNQRVSNQIWRSSFILSRLIMSTFHTHTLHTIFSPYKHLTHITHHTHTQHTQLAVYFSRSAASSGACRSAVLLSYGNRNPRSRLFHSQPKRIPLSYPGLKNTPFSRILDKKTHLFQPKSLILRPSKTPLLKQNAIFFII